MKCGDAKCDGREGEKEVAEKATPERGHLRMVTGCLTSDPVAAGWRRACPPNSPCFGGGFSHPPRCLKAREQTCERVDDCSGARKTCRGVTVGCLYFEVAINYDIHVYSLIKLNIFRCHVRSCLKLEGRCCILLRISVDELHDAGDGESVVPVAVGRDQTESGSTRRRARA